jgi:hypothetical protein
MSRISYFHRLRVAIDSRQSPDVIYQCAYEAAHMVMAGRFKRLAKDYRVDFNHYVADKMLRRLNREKEITDMYKYFRKYVNGLYKTYASEFIAGYAYYADIEKGHFIGDGAIEILLNTGNARRIDERAIEVKDYIESLPKIISGMCSRSRYKNKPCTLLNLYISVLLSVSRHKVISFGLDEEESSYLTYLYNKINDLLRQQMGELFYEDIAFDHKML